MSRVTSNCGWMTTCTLCSSRASSMVTESTRNGMSSVTTSTTECPAADQPASARPGVTTRTAEVPCGRVCASRWWEASAPYRSSGLRSTRSSAATCR